MAGAGYKDFTTGEVLTAANVDNYLMEQTVMVFASAAARTTALAAVLAEGMTSYLKDTNSLEVYDGSNWISASGDLTALTAGTGITITSPTGPVPTVALDVANYGGGQYAAGKNKIINGDFGIWQRGTSVSVPSFYGYGPDRWRTYSYAASSSTMSRQTFTPGTAPVAGYEGAYYMRIVSTNNITFFGQPIEDVRTFAGQTVTVSFWLKAASAISSGSVALDQNFGSGGSATVNTNLGSSLSFTTSWTRYSYTVTLPSISGKTIGTSSYLDLIISAGVINNNIDVWGVQLEAGSTATPFQTATGTLQGELAACQRYLPAITTSSASEIGSGYNLSTTQPFLFIPFQVPARVAPTGITATAANYAVRNTTGSTVSLTAISFNNASVTGGALLGTVASGLVAGQGTTVQLNGTLLFTGCEL